MAEETEKKPGFVLNKKKTEPAENKATAAASANSSTPEKKKIVVVKRKAPAQAQESAAENGENKNVNEEVDEDLKKKVLDSVNLVKNKMNELKVADALEEIFNAYRRCNKYIDETTPWLLAKEETKKDRLATVLYNLIESIRIETVLLQAFLPQSAEENI